MLTGFQGALSFYEQQSYWEPLSFYCDETKQNFTAAEAEVLWDPVKMHFLATKASTHELDYNSLTSAEQTQFDASRHTEVQGILDAEAMKILTVEDDARIRATCPERVLPNRWTEKWEDMGPDAQHIAKSRLIVLGFHDPDIDFLHRTVPSPESESIMWVLQLLASFQCRALIADVKVAFMQGLKRQRP